MIEITRLKKRTGSLSKKIHRGPDGKPANDSSNCRMSDGTAYRQPCSDLREFAALIEGMPHNECIALGALRHDIADQVSIVRKAAKKCGEAGFVSRTQDIIGYVKKQPTLVLLDFDRKGMPPATGEHIDKAGGFLAAVGEVCPDLVNAGYVRRASTSSNITDITSGDPIPAGGQDVFVLIADGADVKRFLYTLHDRCWLAGLGWFIVGKSGQLLDRSAVDRCVFGGERLVFEGPPELEPCYRQQGKREAFVHEGPALDTVTACPDLDASEQADLAHLQTVAKQALGRECDEARKAFIKERADAAVAKGMPRAKAEAMAEGWGKGTLRPGVVITFDDSKLGETDVGAILVEPHKYEGEACADPIEGPAYGPVTAKFFLHPDGTPFIKSFAHGGAHYKLVHDYDSIEAAIRTANKKEAARTFVRLALNADIDSVEVEALTKIAATQAGAGVRAVQKLLKEAKAQKRAAAAQTVRNKAAAQSKRVRVKKIPPDAEIGPVMKLIDGFLAAVVADEPPMRDVEGLPVKVTCRSSVGLHELTSHGANDSEEETSRLPPPKTPLLTQLGRESLELLIWDHIAFVEETEDGERYVAPCGKFVLHYLVYDRSVLPTVHAVQTMPVVLPDDTLLTDTGLNRKYEIVFRIEPALIAFIPTQEED